MEQWRELPPFGKEELEEIGKNLRRLRKTKGWTQERLAAEVHKDPTMISRHEHGQQSFGIDGLICYSIALSCQPTDLFPEFAREYFIQHSDPLLGQMNRLNERQREQVSSYIRFLLQQGS